MRTTARQIARTLRERIRAARLEKPDPRERELRLQQLLEQLPPEPASHWPWWALPLIAGLAAAWVLQRH